MHCSDFFRGYRFAVYLAIQYFDKGIDMNKLVRVGMMLLGSLLAFQASAQEITTLSKVVSGMPNGQKQEIRVITATLNPGAKTNYHTHPFPVTLYVLKGAFTLELDGQKPITVNAGEAIVEPQTLK